jgi:hypothetical protein
MFRLHEFECPACKRRQEELIDTPPNLVHIHCSRCRTVMDHVVVGGKHYTFEPLWHPHLDHKPVYIDSWRKFKQELRRRNLSSEYVD